MKLTKKQLSLAEKIINDTTNVRKKITLYKKNDAGLAMFRLTAFNNIQDAIICRVKNKPYTKRINEFLDFWADGSDLGDNIQHLFSAIKDYKS